MKHTTRAVKVGNVIIGDGRFVVVAGPCSIESQEHFSDVARFVGSHGASLLRGGIFKLRTNPGSFQGLGHAGYRIAQQIREEVGLPLVVEVTDPRQIHDLDAIVDCFQVGSRNMHNYELLKELGLTRKPVLLKRSFAGLIKEWLYAADYVFKGGNDQVILCERGIRTFETTTRNTLDLNAVAYLKATTNFPVLVDPSHGTGSSELVEPLSLAAAAVGADGIIVEVHPVPSQALSDGMQALNYPQFEHLTLKLDTLLHALGRTRTVAQ
jgi:3-deoxy-7-phosphoheptulonate synthase